MIYPIVYIDKVVVVVWMLWTELGFTLSNDLPFTLDGKFYAGKEKHKNKKHLINEDNLNLVNEKSFGIWKCLFIEKFRAINVLIPHNPMHIMCAQCSIKSITLNEIRSQYKNNRTHTSPKVEMDKVWPKIGNVFF